jgi:hypothetical protein
MSGMDNLGPSQAYDFYKSGVSTGGDTGLHAPYLGPNPREQKMTAWEQRSHAKWNMPDAYLGENRRLRDTMEDYMITAQFDWYTERIMPWFKSEDIEFQWTEWENNPHYLGITPHQTASRVITQKRKIRKASMVRRGIAFEFERDFVATALGRTAFMAGFGQMARSVQETANVLVIRALLNAQHTQWAYQRKYGILKDFELDEYHERRANRFMAAQKDDKGLEKLSTEIEAEQEAYGGKADVWILDRAIIDYVDTVPDNRTLYYKGGQEAVDRINGRSNGTQAAGGTMGNLRRLDPEGMIRNTPVFIAKSFHVENLNGSDLMSRVTEIGVYNTMIDRCTDFFDYKTESRRIRVYDNDIDNWSDIDFEYALRHCPIWQEDGELKDVYSGKGRKSHAAAKDADYDFLSYRVGPDRKNIKYVGDISLNYQTEHDMIDGAKSLLSAATYGDSNAATKMMQSFAETSDVGKSFVDAVRNLTGGNNVFTASLIDADAFKTNYENLNSALAVPLQSNIGLAVSGSSDSVSQLEERFVSGVVGAPLPSSYKAQVQKIASDASVDWKIRANSVKDLVLEALKADASSVQVVETPADVDKWHKTNMSDFTGKRASQFAQTSADNEVSEGQYFAVDAPLPRGFRWANPNEIKKPILSRLPAFQDFMAAKAPVSQSTASSFRGRAHIGRGAGATQGGLGAAEQREAMKRDEANSMSVPNNRSRTVFGYTPGDDMGSLGNMAALVNKINSSGAHPLLKALAIIYAGTPFNRDILCNYAKNNVAVKIGLALFRPHCTYRTKYGIKCLSGGGAGYTFFGHSNMQIEHEAARKVIFYISFYAFKSFYAYISFYAFKSF